MKRLLCVTAVALWPCVAPAQTAGGISLLPAEPARWDVSGDVGWLSRNKSDIAPDWNDWYDVPGGGLSVGYYWTPHLKTDVRLAFSGEGRVHQEERIVIPGAPFPGFRLREHRFRTATLGAGIAYQFFENQWFHPYLGGGLEMLRESHQQFAHDRNTGGTLDSVRVSWAARPFAAGGFKWYVNEHGFVRSDLRLSVGSGGVSHVGWTAGIGVDL